MTVTDEGRRLNREATPGPWWSDESDLSWRLFGSAMLPHGKQILKAPKEHPHQQPYWPDEADAALIVWLRNHADALVAAVEALHDMAYNFDAAQWSQNLSQRRAYERARAALAPFTEEPSDASR